MIGSESTNILYITLVETVKCNSSRRSPHPAISLSAFLSVSNFASYFLILKFWFYLSQGALKIKGTPHNAVVNKYRIMPLSSTAPATLGHLLPCLRMDYPLPPPASRVFRPLMKAWRMPQCCQPVFLHHHPTKNKVTSERRESPLDGQSVPLHSSFRPHSSWCSQAV